jgi:hypothetical protein
MRSTKVDDLLAARMQSDPAADVRISAMDAAQVREPSDVLVRAVSSTAVNAEDAHVRYRAVELIGQWMPQRPELRSTLQQVATKDPEAKIRERANGSL